ncbi:hypothetical protein [Glycomyces sp. NPDC048151]|uniref:hypothetical protein n=1 Tax=Glycomyces sp. NPDC048151 TaxID=3364002 RepID=UPI00371DD6AE
MHSESNDAGSTSDDASTRHLDAESVAALAAIKAEIQEYGLAEGVAIWYIDAADTMQKMSLTGKVYDVHDNALDGKEYSRCEFGIDFKDLISVRFQRSRRRKRA